MENFFFRAVCNISILYFYKTKKLIKFFTFWSKQYQIWKKLVEKI